EGAEGNARVESCVDTWYIKAYEISKLQFAAFCCCTRGRSISAAVWPVSKTQELVEQHCWPCACRDTVLIGNMPTPVMAALRQAARDHMACLEPVTWPRVLATQVQRVYACAQPDCRRSSAERKRDPASKRLSEALLPQPHQPAHRFPDDALL